MKKSELQSGMCVQTQSNRYGFVELDRNRINICYDPDVIDDKDAVLEMVSLDNVFEYGDGQLGVGVIVTEEHLTKYPDVYGDYSVGEVCIYYEIVAVFEFSRIYFNGVGAHPPIIVD